MVKTKADRLSLTGPHTGTGHDQGGQPLIKASGTPPARAYLQLPHSLLGGLQPLASLLKLAPQAPALFSGRLQRTRKGS